MNYLDVVRDDGAMLLLRHRHLGALLATLLLTPAAAWIFMKGEIAAGLFLSLLAIAAWGSLLSFETITVDRASGTLTIDERVWPRAAKSRVHPLAEARAIDVRTTGDRAYRIFTPSWKIRLLVVHEKDPIEIANVSNEAAAWRYAAKLASRLNVAAVDHDAVSWSGAHIDELTRPPGNGISVTNEADRWRFTLRGRRMTTVAMLLMAATVLLTGFALAGAVTAALALIIVLPLFITALLQHPALVVAPDGVQSGFVAFGAFVPRKRIAKHEIESIALVRTIDRAASGRDLLIRSRATAIRSGSLLSADEIVWLATAVEQIVRSV